MTSLQRLAVQLYVKSEQEAGPDGRTTLVGAEELRTITQEFWKALIFINQAVYMIKFISGFHRLGFKLISGICASQFNFWEAVKKRRLNNRSFSKHLRDILCILVQTRMILLYHIWWHPGSFHCLVTIKHNIYYLYIRYVSCYQLWG